MITIQPYKEHYTNGFVVWGHAEFAEHGSDIVCSAVSAITQMTELSVKRYSDTDANQKSGYLSVEIQQPNKYTECLIESMLNSLRIIANQHPNYVELLEEK